MTTCITFRTDDTPRFANRRLDRGTAQVIGSSLEAGLFWGFLKIHVKWGRGNDIPATVQYSTVQYLKCPLTNMLRVRQTPAGLT